MVGRVRAIPLAASCLGLIVAQPTAALSGQLEQSAPVAVAVSILPQKYFVERIAGRNASVLVLVGPGRSPATFEPTPRQMVQLADARVYFRIGVPFESVWADRFEAVNPSMKLVDTQAGIELRNLGDSAGEQGSRHYVVADPHIWTDPVLMVVVARHILEAMVEVDPQRRDEYRANHADLVADLELVDREIRQLMDSVASRTLVVFHAAWGYFADRYGLSQIVIESGGKEPGSKALAEVIRLAEQEEVKVVVVQEQFSDRSAQRVAEAIGADVLKLDPLAEDWLANIRRVARSLYLALQRR
jgi:zinc transport system substrate-binding protein